MVIPVFKAKVENSKLILQCSKQDYEKYLYTLNGAEVGITIKKTKKPRDIRSDKQNKYYWGVLIDLLSSELGYTKDEMHEILKYQFLTDRSGKFPIVRSTSSLDTEEMEVYLSFIREWAGKELHIYLPLPNETEYDY